jgi:membrane protein implicated in regulation of membrane protease activity
MADETPQGPGDEPEELPRTPFDNPFFLPVMLWIFAAWFGYDGWFNPDMEWINFNRYGFAIIAVLAIYFTRKAVRERREAKVSTQARGGS